MTTAARTDDSEGAAMVENTSGRDPAAHLLGAMTEGADGYILGMEAAGQRQLVGSAQMPTEAPWDDLIALGFTRGEDIPDDPMFCEATLPDGWHKERTDHAMWSRIVDERGVERVSVFYKAAFYDRSAFARLARPGYSLATEVIYGEGEPSLPAMWAALTDDERADFWASVDAMVENIERHPDIYGKHQWRVDALLNSR